ncbi:radical SAM/SPASM domain-containing protein [Arcobacter sp. FWKO B]|uniref:radical SAM/SPASM domain-containing protein n=1 Tax=Arcobacter sp. FWKO B TaxID=2593672 RepID=UPI0018A43B16|nr:radical SAM protein [Arcobacter sp. FWKO B]QOG12163.1 4Fe-4S cluster-binding domain-containing protein [Arcobacter sp. FWKO B]
MNNKIELRKNHLKWYTNFNKNFSELREETRNRFMNDKNLKVIQLEITKKCNYNCVMCANSEYNQDEKSSDMSWDIFQNIIDNLPKSVETINLTSYGEATIHPLYKEMIQYIYNKNYKIDIFTNSILFDLNLLKYFNKVIFSYDAISENVFKQIRGIQNSTITAENIKKAVSLRNRYKLNTKISINMVCSYINWREGYNLMEFCEEAQVDELFITSVNNNFYYLNGDKFKKLETDLHKSIDEVNWDYFVETYESKDYNFPLYLWYPKRDMIGFCRFTFNEIMIDKNGNINLCCRSNNTVIGNINDMSIEEAFEHPIMSNVRNAHYNFSKHPICSLCSDGYPI